MANIIIEKIQNKILKKNNKEFAVQDNRKTFPKEQLAYILNQMAWTAYKKLFEAKVDYEKGTFRIVDNVMISEEDADNLQSYITYLTICSSLKSKKTYLQKLCIPKELIQQSDFWKDFDDIRFQILKELL